MPFHVLHIAADPDVRESVALSLAAEPAFAVLSCVCEDDALGIMARWTPDLVICDADGSAAERPELLTGAGSDPAMARVPVVFTLPGDQACAIDRVKSLGAAGVILKPLDPVTLANSVRNCLRAAKLDTLRHSFFQRLQTETAALAQCAEKLVDDPPSMEALDELQSRVHKLAGAAGVFGFKDISAASSQLEQTVIGFRSGDLPTEKIITDLGALRLCLDRVRREPLQNDDAA